MIRGTCGHEIPSFEDVREVLVKDVTPEGTPAISMESICEKCYERLLEENMLLLTKEHVRQYNKGFLKLRKR